MRKPPPDLDAGITLSDDNILSFDGMSFPCDGTEEDTARLINKHSKTRMASVLAGDVWIRARDMEAIPPELEGTLLADLSDDELALAVMAQLRAVKSREKRLAAQTKMHATAVAKNGAGTEVQFDTLKNKKLRAALEKYGACIECFKQGVDPALPVSMWAPGSKLCDKHIVEVKQDTANRYGLRTITPSISPKVAETRARRRKDVARVRAKAAKKARKKGRK